MWISAGVQGVSLVVAYFAGGTFFPYLFLWLSCVTILRGWKPAWFAIHHDAQIIAGTKYYREESVRAWIVAWGMSLILAWGSSWLHLKIVPEKQDLAKTILDGVKQLWDQQKPNATPQSPKPESTKTNPSPKTITQEPIEHITQRAYLYAAVSSILLADIIRKNDGGDPCCGLYVRYEITLYNRGETPAFEPKLEFTKLTQADMIDRTLEAPNIGGHDSTVITAEKSFRLGGLRTVTDLLERVDTDWPITEDIRLSYIDAFKIQRKEDSKLSMPVRRLLGGKLRELLLRKAETIK